MNARNQYENEGAWIIILEAILASQLLTLAIIRSFISHDNTMPKNSTTTSKYTKYWWMNISAAKYKYASYLFSCSCSCRWGRKYYISVLFQLDFWGSQNRHHYLSLSNIIVLNHSNANYSMNINQIIYYNICFENIHTTSAQHGPSTTHRPCNCNCNSPNSMHLQYLTAGRRKKNNVKK